MLDSQAIEIGSSMCPKNITLVIKGKMLSVVVWACY